MRSQNGLPLGILGYGGVPAVNPGILDQNCHDPPIARPTLGKADWHLEEFIGLPLRLPGPTRADRFEPPDLGLRSSDDDGPNVVEVVPLARFVPIDRFR